MVRSAKYKYNIYKGGEPREMLLHMVEDPGEMKNLALDEGYSDILMAHRRMVHEWAVESGDRMSVPYLPPVQD